MDIQKMMFALNSRLNLIITDCCGGFSSNEGRGDASRGIRTDVFTEILKRKGTHHASRLEIEVPTPHEETWRQLMFNRAGVVHVAAVPIGINAKGSKKYGGYMTYVLCESLSASPAELDDSIPIPDDFVSWYGMVWYPMQKIHRETFGHLASANPNPGNLSFRVVGTIGPITLGFDDAAEVVVKARFYNEANKILFLKGRDGVTARVMVGSPAQVAQGFYDVFNERGETGTGLYESIVRRGQGAQLWLFENDVAKRSAGRRDFRVVLK